MGRLLCGVILFLGSSLLAAPARDHGACGGFPRLPVATPEGSCLAVVAQGAPFRIPRKMIQLPGQRRYIVSDVGSWDVLNQGRLLLLDMTTNTPKVSVLLEGLRYPHSLAIGPDRKVYANDMTSLFRFDPALLPRVRIETVVTDLAPDEDSLHPLRHFTFGRSAHDRWDLYVNVGSTGDACLENLDESGLCRERASHGVLIRHRYLGSYSWSQRGEVFAKGLRNSMGLASHRSGTLLQAENARNNSDLLNEPHEPFDEINLIERGGDYGWPYCFNFEAKSPEWRQDSRLDCESSAVKRPWILLPPHSAPLDALFYESSFFPWLSKHLVISLHGLSYGTGHRVVSVEVDEQGRPVPSEDAFSWPYTGLDGKDGWRFETPTAGLRRHSFLAPVVGSWAAQNTLGLARGAPVGLLEDEAGPLWIVDDRSAMILRLDRGESFTPPADDPPPPPGPPPRPLTEAEILADADLAAGWSLLSAEVFRPRCATCHRVSLGAILEQTNWLDWSSMHASPLVLRLEGRGGRRMPPNRPLTDELIGQVRDWIGALDERARNERKTTEQ